MNEIRLKRAIGLRRWAQMLRDKAEDPGVYQKSLLHTIETMPGQPPQERYCASGLLEVAAHPEGTPHEEIWEQTDDEGEYKAVYSPKWNGSETAPDAETVFSLGLWPECNPFALREMEQGDNPDPALQQHSFPDMVFIPLDQIEDPAAILERDKGWPTWTTTSTSSWARSPTPGRGTGWTSPPSPSGAPQKSRRSPAASVNGAIWTNRAGG